MLFAPHSMRGNQMTCTYCGMEHGRAQCEVTDLKDNIDQLSELIEDQAAVICHQIQELENSESQTTH